MSVLVSIVVPTCRRPRYLDRCLAALLAQNFPADAYEIIVVDDSPEDPATRRLVEQWQHRLQASYAVITRPELYPVPATGLPVQAQAGFQYHLQASLPQSPQLIYLPATRTKGPAAARNLGWRSAGGEIIAFTDDDCIPDPNWLSNGLAAFEDGVVAVSGRVIVPLPPEPTDHEYNMTGLERSDFITANCFYRRSVLELVNGFDERFRAAWREDSDLYFTIRELNLPLAWSTEALVVHPIRPEPWGSSLRQQRKSFYNALLYKKHPELYRRYIQPAPPWHYYGILLSLAGGLSGLALGNPLLAGAGLAIWLGLTARFCYKRLRHTSRAPEHVAEMAITSLIIPFLSIYWRIRGALHWKVLFL